MNMYGTIALAEVYLFRPERNEVARKLIHYENKVKVKFLARHAGVLRSGGVVVLVRYLSTSGHIQVSATSHPGKTSRLSIE
jgi:hypothetical protein